MPQYNPQELAEVTGGRWIRIPKDPLTGFCIDSRVVQRGDIFLALRSEKADGHAYIGKAFRAGAVAAIVEKIPQEEGEEGAILVVPSVLKALQSIAKAWRRKVNPWIIGVTGSVGKSTTKEWTAAFLSDWRETASTYANYNNEIGLPLSLLAMETRAEMGVFEAGMSHPKDMEPLCCIMEPNAAIVTAIAPVHIEFFESLQGIADEKATILRGLPKDGFAVLDVRGEYFEYLVTQTPCRVVGVAVVEAGELVPEKADYVGVIQDETVGAFSLRGPGLKGDEKVVLGRPGRHNLLDALLALAAAHEAGVPWEVILRRIGNLPSMKMRWERFAQGGVEWVNDAYNASPASMEASLRSFAMMTRGETCVRVFVLGDMFELGVGAPEYHQIIKRVLGEIETKESDILICVGELARNYAGGAFRGRTYTATDALDAALILRREVDENSIVLLKASHGMHLERVPGYFLHPMKEIEGEKSRALILGAGKSGLAAQRFLETQKVATRLLEGDETFPKDGDFQVAIVSPGIPGGHPWLEACKERGIPVYSEMELGARFWRGRILAVTGSKGKSSVVKLCAEGLTACGEDAEPCGNYGTPLCELLLREKPPKWAVVEVSSFQLEHVKNFRPEIAILLNLQADHLDRHGTMQAYALAKMQIFAKMGEEDFAIIEREAFEQVKSYGVSMPKIFSEGENFNGQKKFEQASGWRFLGSESSMAEVCSELGYFASKILHPAAEAAGLALERAGLSTEEIAEAFRRFQPLKHRMQCVAEEGGVLYLDNSKATSISALLAALMMVERPVRLIAGGRLKEGIPAGEKIFVEKTPQKVYLIGECSQLLYEAWKRVVPCEICGTMECAVESAIRDAKPGETILLAPGTASFDQFNNYGERGECFARCVRETLQKAAK